MGCCRLPLSGLSYEIEEGSKDYKMPVGSPLSQRTNPVGPSAACSAHSPARPVGRPPAGSLAGVSHRASDARRTFSRDRFERLRLLRREKRKINTSPLTCLPLERASETSATSQTSTLQTTTIPPGLQCNNLSLSQTGTKLVFNSENRYMQTPPRFRRSLRGKLSATTHCSSIC